MTTEKRDLLIAAPERWDEACFAAPAIRALIASGLSVGILCRETQSDFWKTIDQLQVLPFPDNASAGKIAKSLKTTWEAALLFEASPTAKATRSANIACRIGPPAKALDKLLTHPLEAAITPLEHRVRYYLAAAEAMGVNVRNPEFFASATITTDTTQQSILLCPDSDFGAHHEWALKRWETLAGTLVERGQSITIACVPRGRELGSSLAKRLGDKAAQVDIRDLAAALPTLASYPQVVSADGSLPHLAAHLGATCVTLFGPNDPHWKRPLGQRHGIARHHVECAPCLLEKCPLDLRCQHELQVDEVMSIIEQTLENKG